MTYARQFENLDYLYYDGREAMGFNSKRIQEYQKFELEGKI